MIVIVSNDVDEAASVPVAVRFDVVIPPKTVMLFVVTLPAFVTVWRFGVVPLGQFVPFARQTC